MFVLLSSSSLLLYIIIIIIIIITTPLRHIDSLLRSIIINRILDHCDIVNPLFYH